MSGGEDMDEGVCRFVVQLCLLTSGRSEYALDIRRRQIGAVVLSTMSAREASDIVAQASSLSDPVGVVNGFGQ